MRMVCLLLALACVGCGNLTPAAGALAGAEVASIAVLGRGIVDLGVSAVTGKDCSLVRLDKGQTYCAPPETAPGQGPFCTRSLGVVDCWDNPAALRRPTPVGDTPPPTAAQETYRTSRWPKAFAFGP